MADSLLLIDTLIRGVAIGAVLVTGLAVWRSAVTNSTRIVSLAMALSVAAWLISEARPLWAAFGDSYLLMTASMPVGALYWLFVLCVFEDRRATPLLWSPTAILILTGIFSGFGPPDGWLWLTRNLLSGGLAIHAAVVIARGWRGDLVESRRRVRAVLMLLTSLYVVMEVAISVAHKLDPGRPWLVLSVGEPLGGGIIAVLILAIAALFLQARTSLFGRPARAEGVAPAATEVAEQRLIEGLQAAMADGAWRREGLTIGDLAQELQIPEHRLRRLINQQLGHRNFADFVNIHRIEAAKARLSDPAEARTTIAAIAYDLGYGSLGPFNRAFRAATGRTPTEWRRAGAASPKSNEAS